MYQKNVRAINFIEEKTSKPMRRFDNLPVKKDYVMIW